MPELCCASAPMSDNYPLSDLTARVLGTASDDDLVAEYLLSSRAANTTRAYAADLRDFQTWGGSIPSQPDQVARYIASSAQVLKPATLRRRLAALASVHRDQGLPDPTKAPLVRRVLQGIERRHGVSQTQVRPLMIDDLSAIVVAFASTARDLRDRAILLVGFFGAFRRSELVGLKIEDLEFVEAGIRVTIRSSKTDQTSQGRMLGLRSRDDHLCPVAAVRAWIACAQVEAGPLFPRSAGKGPLNARTVARIIKKRAAALGLDTHQYAGHSLRAGFATSAAMAGFDAVLIARQTGHKSQQMLARYVRPEALESLKVL